MSVNGKSSQCDVVVIGAGPYGLSAAVHLKAKGMAVRVFGEPMAFWANKMPEGMLLRSPRVASNLSHPERGYMLDDYEAAANLEPRSPLPLDTFVDYGKWFRHQLNGEVDHRDVLRVRREQGRFRLTLQNGEELHTKRVVVAAGVGPFRKKPAVFDNIAPERAIHCYELRDVSRFSSRRVAVIGAGQSALESAALLHEAGAEVEIIARQGELKWIGQHPWLHRMGPVSSMLYSSHDVGPMGISRLVAYPNLVSRIPLKLRDKIRTRAVRPAGSRWLPERLKNVKITTGRGLTKAQEQGEELVLSLDDGTERHVDHVVMGTGYKVNISRYEFLPVELMRNINQFDGYPRLTRGFRCSVPGLHFIGATAARSFGPLLNFVAGAEFASRELAACLTKDRG